MPLLDLEATKLACNDRRGYQVCIDLYKYAMWFTPFVDSELIADCFELAREARELDMRAAPYDLTALGYEPIRVETGAGRVEYTARQRIISEQAAPLRARLLDAVTRLEAVR